MKRNDTLVKCSRRECSLHLACGSAHPEDLLPEASFEDEDMFIQAPWKPEACATFSLRAKLSREGAAPTKGRTPRHNKLRGRNLNLPEPPDLMVTRHIKEGIDIKKEGK